MKVCTLKIPHDILGLARTKVIIIIVRVYSFVIFNTRPFYVHM